MPINNRSVIKLLSEDKFKDLEIYINDPDYRNKNHNVFQEVLHGLRLTANQNELDLIDAIIAYCRGDRNNPYAATNNFYESRSHINHRNNTNSVFRISTNFFPPVVEAESKSVDSLKTMEKSTSEPVAKLYKF